jgi:hypothetical protein
MYVGSMLVLCWSLPAVVLAEHGHRGCAASCGSDPSGFTPRVDSCLRSRLLPVVLCIIC